MRYFMFLLILSSCVSLDQQHFDQANSQVHEADKKQIIASEFLFEKTLAGDPTPIQIGQNLTTEMLKESNIESPLIITRYGTITAGQLISYTNNEEVIEIIGDYLFIPITYGGADPSEHILYELIWNSKHYTYANNETAADLIISFKNTDLRKVLINKMLRFDLSPLKIDDMNSIRINILGYEKELIYRY